jgi:hypothetical protein
VLVPVRAYFTLPMENTFITPCAVCETHHGEDLNIFDIISNALLQLQHYERDINIDRKEIIKGMRDNLCILMRTLLTTHINVQTAMNRPVILNN